MMLLKRHYFSTNWVWDGDHTYCVHYMGGLTHQRLIIGWQYSDFDPDNC